MQAVALLNIWSGDCPMEALYIVLRMYLCVCGCMCVCICRYLYINYINMHNMYTYTNVYIKNDFKFMEKVPGSKCSKMAHS